MPRNLLKRLLPHPDTLRGHRSLRPVQALLHDPCLWHLNRRSVTRAVFIGIATAFIPLPIHMLVAAALSVFVRCNLALAVALVWISNPFTIPPVFYACFRVGNWLLGRAHAPAGFAFTLRGIADGMATSWQPLLLGCAVCGLGLASLAWLLTDLGWRYSVRWRWHQRQRQRPPAR